MVLEFQTENELVKQIGSRQCLAVISLLSILLMAATAGILAVSITAKKFVCAVLCFAVLVALLAILIVISKHYKNAEKKSNHYPYKIAYLHEFDFEDIKQRLSHLSNNEDCRDFSNESAYFCILNRTYRNRVLLVNMPDFDKSVFASRKNKINKSINKEFQISQWASMEKAYKMMRTNIIVANEVNDSLYDFISNNAGTLLRRVEGVINFAIVGNCLIVPPFFGDADIMEIGRYKKSIKFIKTILE